MKLYFRSTATNKRYEIVKLDQQSKKVTMRNEYGEFTESYDKEKFKKMGYVLEQGG